MNRRCPGTYQPHAVESRTRFRQRSCSNETRMIIEGSRLTVKIGDYNKAKGYKNRRIFVGAKRVKMKGLKILENKYS